MDQDRIDRVTRRARSEPVETAIGRMRGSVIADAIIQKVRLQRVVERAAVIEGPALLTIRPEARESLADMLGRILSDTMPVPITAQRRGLCSLRTEYEALSPDERRDELERHLWATAEPGRTRTCYSDLLDAMGTGR